MESNGIYWKPVFNILEDYFEIIFTNAQRIKNVPGQKTDVANAEWIAKLLRYGLIEKSFVPPVDIRELRDLTHLRKKMIGKWKGNAKNMYILFTQKKMSTKYIKST